MSGIKYGVSLYSFTGDMYTVVGLSDAMREIADIGATGIEILGEAHVPDYPEPSPRWVDEWRELLEAYTLEPTNYGSWIDTTLWSHRYITPEEGVALLSRDLRLAHLLGFTSVRPKIGVISADLTPHPMWEEVVVRSLDLAHELDVVICPEIHAPTPLKHPVVEGYVSLIERTGTDHFRILIDTGIFQTRVNTVDVAGLRDDAQDEWRQPLAVPMQDFVEVLPYTWFIQGKFFDIDDGLVDQQIPWGDIMRTLVESDWSGYVSSEYEGDRSPYRSFEQVRRQHALLRMLERDLSSS